MDEVDTMREKEVDRAVQYFYTLADGTVRRHGALTYLLADEVPGMPLSALRLTLNSAFMSTTANTILLCCVGCTCYQLCSPVTDI